MLKLVRLYSEDDLFREIIFKPGMNIIRGDNSIDEDGKVTSRRQNGVGKSFSIELIDFCLLRRLSESKIDKVQDKYFPRNSFVYLHFNASGRDFIIARNRNGEIKIKNDRGLFQKYGFEDAKQYLELITQLDETPLSWRDYLNFFVKHEDYTYTSFNLLYRSSYSDLMKIHFYLFGISLETLKTIMQAFQSYDQAIIVRKDVNKRLADLGWDIEQIRTKKNEIDQKVERLEDDFAYENLIEDYSSKQEEMSEIEKSVTEMIEQKSLLTIELAELNDFIDDFEDDIYIDDDDVKTVFNKYNKGLGELINKDLDQLLKFRNQLANFKTTITNSKKKQLLDDISSLSDKIHTQSQRLDKFYKDISKSDKNAIVKSFRVYQDDIQNTKEYDQYIEQHDRAEAQILDAKTKYALAINELHEIIATLKERREAFEKDFLEIHQRVTGSDSASFDFSVNVDSTVARKKDFFKFSVEVETGGSRGSNQIRAAIYDAAVHKNSYTKTKTIGLLIHDNLVFGTMDKESSINFLNLMSTFKDDELQYIATVNNDDFDYVELKDQFKFNVDDKEAINLTKATPLFHEIHSDFMKE